MLSIIAVKKYSSVCAVQVLPVCALMYHAFEIFLDALRVAQTNLAKRSSPPNYSSTPRQQTNNAIIHGSRTIPLGKYYSDR